MLSLSQYGAFWLYAFISLVGFVGLYFTLPETKGLHLEEIQSLFTRPGDPPLHHTSKPISINEGVAEEGFQRALPGEVDE